MTPLAPDWPSKDTKPTRWKVQHNARVEIVEDTQAMTPVAHVYSRGKAYGVTYRMPVEAHARLMAAAPELRNMVRELKERLRLICQSMPDQGPIDAWALIGSAEGLMARIVDGGESIP